MSEFSESYHVYAKGREELLVKLEEAGIPGLAFPTANDWTTFVPFGASKIYLSRAAEFGAFASLLSQIAEAIVLDYRYAEDHLWGFALYRAGELIGHYVCAWDPNFAIERDLNGDALEVLATISRRSTELEGVLGARSHEDVVERGLPGNFAEILGLKHFQWLSPAYAQTEPEPYIAAGAVRIGRRPVPPEKRVRKPPIRRVVLPRPDPSAREVFDLVAPLVRDWDPSFYARSVGLARLPTERTLFGTLMLPNGRLGSVGGWYVTFDSELRESVIHLTVFANGHVSTIARKGLPRQILDGKPYIPKPLPAVWVDSTKIAEVLNEKWPRSRTGDPLPLSRVQFCLQEWGQERRQVWSVNFFRDESYDASREHFLIDSITGDVLTGKV